MSYARWFDEGVVAVLDPGTDVECPADCTESQVCGFCDGTTCPTHGKDSEFNADDSHLDDTCRGPAHRRCHATECRDSSCWE